MVARPIQPGELLELAYELAGRGSGRGRPRTAHLRRSISTAYYALFHELTRRSVEKLLESSSWGPRESAVTRWLSHTDLASLAQAASGSGSQALRDALGPLSSDVVRIAQNFLDLQDARHEADYDHLFDVSRSTALGYVESAADSVARSSALVAGNDSSYRRFLGLAIGAVKVAKRRS